MAEHVLELATRVTDASGKCSCDKWDTPLIPDGSFKVFKGMDSQVFTWTGESVVRARFRCHQMARGALDG